MSKRRQSVDSSQKKSKRACVEEARHILLDSNDEKDKSLHKKAEQVYIFLYKRIFHFCIIAKTAFRVLMPRMQNVLGKPALDRSICHGPTWPKGLIYMKIAHSLIFPERYTPDSTRLHGYHGNTTI